MPAACAGAVAKYPTIIGGVTGNPYYELLCGGTITTGTGAVNKNGDPTATGTFVFGQPHWYPIGTP